MQYDPTVGQAGSAPWPDFSAQRFGTPDSQGQLNMLQLLMHLFGAQSPTQPQQAQPLPSRPDPNRYGNTSNPGPPAPAPEQQPFGLSGSGTLGHQVLFGLLKYLLQ